MKTGDRLELSATGYAREGDAVAVSEGIEVWIPHLLAGERGLVRIEHVGRMVPERPRRAHALLLEVRAPSPARVAPRCRDHELADGRCSGCPWMMATPAFQREAKRQLLEAEYGLSVSEVIAGEDDWGYRWSSKRVARSHGGRLHLGSYRRGNHQVADMDLCAVDHPDIAAAAREIVEVGTRLGIEAYDERSRQGDLRYVWFKTNGMGDVLVTLITASETSRARELAEALGLPSGVAWSIQSDEGNAMRGTTVTTLTGRPTIAVELAGKRVDVGALGFLQPNPKVAERAYRDLCDGASGLLAFDLYAGAGITTALLATTCERVVACESYEESARATGAVAETADVFLAREFEAGAAPTVILANPPRTGLGDAVCDALVAFAARGLSELRMMSCNPATLRRDLDRLARAFELRELRAYDTLPHTPHVELVAKLHARSKSR